MNDAAGDKPYEETISTHRRRNSTPSQKEEPGAKEESSRGEGSSGKDKTPDIAELIHQLTLLKKKNEELEKSLATLKTPEKSRYVVVLCLFLLLFIKFIIFFYDYFWCK